MVTVAFLSGKMRILAILPRRASAAGLRRSSLQHLSIPLPAQTRDARILRQDKDVASRPVHDELWRGDTPGHRVPADDLRRHGTSTQSCSDPRGIRSHGSFSLRWPAAQVPQ